MTAIYTWGSILLHRTHKGLLMVTKVKLRRGRPSLFKDKEVLLAFMRSHSDSYKTDPKLAKKAMHLSDLAEAVMVHFGLAKDKEGNRLKKPDPLWEKRREVVRQAISQKKNSKTGVIRSLVHLNGIWYDDYPWAVSLKNPSFQQQVASK